MVPRFSMSSSRVLVDLHVDRQLCLRGDHLPIGEHLELNPMERIGSI